MARYITEFVGTFFLVFSISLAVNTQDPTLTALGIGGMLTVMVYMGGHISGAHYNPAITVAFFMRGRFPASEIAPYVGSQLLGSLAAAFVGGVVTGNTGILAPSSDYGVLTWLLIEIMFTLALTLVILNVASVDKVGVSNNGYYGLAIGLTIVAIVIMGGPISGGGYNPAVGAGLTIVDALMGGNSIAHLWLYVVGPMIGGVLGAIVFRPMNPDQ